MAPSRLLRSLVALSLVMAPLSVAVASPAHAPPLPSGGVGNFASPPTANLRCLGNSVRSPKGFGPLLTSTPVGYGPAEIQSAFNPGGLHGNGRTVAIVDAMDAP